jgi:thiaminase/transcriptional activator TenA
MFMKISKKLYRLAIKQWNDYEEIPYLRQMGEGTLDPDAYWYYIVQDYLYLQEYLKLLGLGIAKAPDFKTENFFAESLQGTRTMELEHMREVMRNAGIELRQIKRRLLAPSTEVYLQYMQNLCWQGDAATVAVTVLACSESFEIIAKAMKKRHPGCDKQKIYGNWIQSYTDPAYADANRKLEEITDHLTKNRGKEDLKAYTRIFENCTYYEKQFWQDVYIHRLPEGFVRLSAEEEEKKKEELPTPQEKAPEGKLDSMEEKTCGETLTPESDTSPAGAEKTETAEIPDSGENNSVK